MTEVEPNFEDVTPHPEDFIRSISEQGYRLETAIADLIDNSISADADKVEILLDTESKPFTLFIADNGNGMDDQQLKSAMRFPSSSMETTRGKSDLGRFGLGLKTASFSQCRCFSVLSRRNGHEEFRGRTWDLNLLRQRGWVLKIESTEQVDELLSKYNSTSNSHLGSFDKPFEAKTIVVWRGLHKFESYISEHNGAEVLKTELTETTRGHLSLVFHRFLERRQNRLQIRLNNVRVKPFNPFPTSADGIRRLGLKNRRFGEDTVNVEGFVLPTISIEQVKSGSSIWALHGKSLTDLEGVYIYRADRIILFGEWLNLTGRSQKLQLARMRVEIGNAVDHLLHLNVSKSQVEMPHDLRTGLKEYVAELKSEAEREYFNRTIRSFDRGSNKKSKSLILTNATNRGAQMSINPTFPLVAYLTASLDEAQNIQLNAILRMLNRELNSIRRVHEDSNFTGVVENDGMSKSQLLELVSKLLEDDFDAEFIKSEVINHLGFQIESLPTEVTELLKQEE